MRSRLIKPEFFSDEELALAARCEEPVVEAMIEVGFLVAVDGGHEIHDWVEHK